MKQSLLCFAALMCLVCFFADKAWTYQVAGPEQFIRQSTVIFKGRVEKLGASNLKLLPASDRTAVVLIEEEVSAAKAMGTLKGQEVTVELKQANSVKAGERATFFTTGWMYGEHLGLKEVGHTSAEADSDVLRRQIADARTRADDEKLVAEIQHAQVVIAGKVVATRRLEERRSTSEHDPDWWAAEVEVQTYLKGQPGASPGRMTLLYANSRDVLWVRSPKLKEGEQGIWIAGEYKGGGIFPEKGQARLVVLSPLDFQPVSEMERMRKLTAAAQSR